MAYLYPCRNCTLSKLLCTKRDELRKAIKGLGVTSAKFKCEDRKPAFASGQRVSFCWTLYGEDDGYGYGFGDDLSVEFVGTIIAEVRNGHKFTVRVDAEGEFYDVKPAETFRNGGDVVNVRASDITAIDEPSRTFCADCLQYEGETGRCQGYVGKDRWDNYIPDGCTEAVK